MNLSVSFLSLISKKLRECHAYCPLPCRSLRTITLTGKMERGHYATRGVNVDVVTFQEMERRQLFRYGCVREHDFSLSGRRYSPTPTVNNGST